MGVTTGSQASSDPPSRGERHCLILFLKSTNRLGRLLYVKCLPTDRLLCSKDRGAKIEKKKRLQDMTVK